MGKEIDELMKGVALEESVPDHTSSQEGTEMVRHRSFKDKLDAPPEPNKPRFSLSEKRTRRIQIMVTEQEFHALENNLGRRQSISDYCWKRMKESGFFDEPTSSA